MAGLLGNSPPQAVANTPSGWYDPAKLAAAIAAQGKGKDGRTVLTEQSMLSALNPLSLTFHTVTPLNSLPSGWGGVDQGPMPAGPDALGYATDAHGNRFNVVGTDANGNKLVQFSDNSGGGWQNPTGNGGDRVQPTYSLDKNGNATPVSAGVSYQPSAWVDYGRTIAEMAAALGAVGLGGAALAGAGGAGGGAGAGAGLATDATGATVSAGAAGPGYGAAGAAWTPTAGGLASGAGATYPGTNIAQFSAYTGPGSAPSAQLAGDATGTGIFGSGAAPGGLATDATGATVSADAAGAGYGASGAAWAPSAGGALDFGATSGGLMGPGVLGNGSGLLGSTLGNGTGVLGSGLSLGQVGGLVGAVGGALGSGSGLNTATNKTQNQIDPNLKPYIYGTNGLVPQANATLQSQMATGGLNANQHAGLNSQLSVLNDPNYASGFTQAKNLGQSLMGNSVAGNPFTSGQSSLGANPNGLIGYGSSLLPNQQGLLGQQRKTIQPVAPGGLLGA